MRGSGGIIRWGLKDFHSAVIFFGFCSPVINDVLSGYSSDEGRYIHSGTPACIYSRAPV